MNPNTEILRKKYMDNPPEGMTSEDIRHMSKDDLLAMDYFLVCYKAKKELNCRLSKKALQFSSNSASECRYPKSCLPVTSDYNI